MVASVNKYGGFFIGRHENNDYNAGLLSAALSGIRSICPSSAATKSGDPITTILYEQQWKAAVDFLETNYPGISTNSVCYGVYNTEDPETMENIPELAMITNKLNNIYNMPGSCWDMVSSWKPDGSCFFQSYARLLL